MQKKVWVLLLFIFAASCSSAPKQYCTDLNHLETSSPDLDQQKEFERLNSRCQDLHQITVNRAEFVKHYNVGRNKELKMVCTCENGYLTTVRPKQLGDENPDSKKKLLRFAQICNEGQKDNRYAAGVQLGENALKKFRPNYWSGPSELTAADASNACKSSD